MTRRLVPVALSAFALGALGGCGGDDAETGEGKAPALVVYSREGGIRFEQSELVVAADGTATLRSEGCKVRFPVEDGLRRRLREQMEETDLASIAGDYPAAPGAADTITEVIAIRSDEVRIENFTTAPHEVQRELSPLVVLLREVLAAGESRRNPAC